MKYFIYQGNDHDCGFAALKMYLAILSKDKSYLYIPKPTKREHYTIDDLAQIAEKYGVNLELFTCTKSYYDSLETPIITLIDENHTVVVVKRTKRKIVFYDPGRGKVKMKKEEFLRRWRLAIVGAEHPEVVAKIPKMRQHLLPPKLEIFSNIISLLSAGLLITTFYLLNNKENFLFSLIFLFSFIMSQILDRYLLYRQVHAFDLEFIPKFFTDKTNCTKEKYIEYGEYKKKFFTDNRQLISSVLIAFCITFLLCFNDFRNIFVLLALILIKILEVLILSKNEQENKNVIAEIESECFKDPTKTSELALKAYKKANASVFTNSIKEIFYIFASFIFAVTMMFVTGNSGCNFVIFHFVMYFAGFNSYNTLLSALSNKKENQKNERRFFDQCNL